MIFLNDKNLNFSLLLSSTVKNFKKQSVSGTIKISQKMSTDPSYKGYRLGLQEIWSHLNDR